MQAGTNNELSVVYTVLPGSTSSNRIIHVRERDAAEFKLEYPDFVRMPWRGVRHQVRDAEPGGGAGRQAPAASHRAPRRGQNKDGAARERSGACLR